MTIRKKDQKKDFTGIKTFPVEFALEEIKANININSTTSKRPYKEQLIDTAFKFHSQGNISEAAKYYQLFINKGFEDYRVFSNLGSILKNQGNLKEAASFQLKAIDLKPDFANAYSNLGNILRDLGKLEEAEIYTRKAIDLKPDFANAYSNLGNILSDLGKLLEAELAQRKAIELKPDFAQAHSNLGTILGDLGKLQEAEIFTRRAIELKPDFARAHSNLGSILGDLGKLQEAEIFTRRAIELKPDLAQAHSNLGTILADLGKLKEAEESYSNAISLQSNFTEALMNRAILFFDKKEYNKALKDAHSCNTEESIAFSLEILYAQRNIEEIYKRIQKASETDDKNIRLAAFSSFISEKENKNTSHNFCQNPLSFLHFSNIKFHLNDYGVFINEITKELRDIKTIWEPRKNTTVNGFHTPMHINLFSDCSEKLLQLKNIILNELDAYFLKYERESCSYIQKWPLNKKLKAWHVILKKQGYQVAHIHPSGWLSGVIYLKVVPPLDKDEGAIEFSLNGERYSDVSSPQMTYQPQLGDIVLFPSSLHHRTIPFTTDTDRIVIAFDLLPN